MIKLEKSIDTKRIEVALENFLTENNINVGSNQVDIVKIAKKLGFEVGMLDMQKNEDGFIYVDINENYKIIVVNSNLDLHSKRFTIAHELAHFVLHAKNANLFAHREHNINDDSDDLNEKEADYFAACLLMPEESFKNIYNRFSQITNFNKEILINMCSNYFSTSPESVRRRINELKLG